MHVPLSSLEIDPSNIRRTGRGSEPQFVATIRAKGIIAPLVARPNGVGYLVTDGGKRLDSLLWMVEHGEIAADYPVPIILRDENDAQARETSLITALARIPAHPVDQFRAFKALTQGPEPMPADDIAAHFGITRRQVDQALALGSLSDTILDAWVAGEIKSGQAQAYTLAPDKASQERVFNKLRKRGVWALSEHEIRREFKANQNDGGRLVEFVGVEEYEKAGGRPRRRSPASRILPSRSHSPL